MDAELHLFPVVLLENELLYGTEFPMSAEAMSDEFVIPIGKAKIQRPGDKATVVAYCKGVQLALEAAEQLAKEGIDIEVSLAIFKSWMARAAFVCFLET